MFILIALFYSSFVWKQLKCRNRVSNLFNAILSSALRWRFVLWMEYSSANFKWKHTVGISVWKYRRLLRPRTSKSLEVEELF